MAISVKKLEGDDVPEQYRAQGMDLVFQVQDAEGELHQRRRGRRPGGGVQREGPRQRVTTGGVQNPDDLHVRPRNCA